LSQISDNFPDKTSDWNALFSLSGINTGRSKINPIFFFKELEISLIFENVQSENKVYKLIL